MVVIAEREKEKYDTSNKRPGNTVVVSASVTREFKDLIDDYRLSPTEIVRKGIAVELHDQGIAQYQSQTNRYRADFVKQFNIKMEQMEKEWKAVTTLMGFVDEIIKLRPIFEEVVQKTGGQK